MTCQIDGCFGECEVHNPTTVLSWATDQICSYSALALVLDKVNYGTLEPNYITVSPSQYTKIKTFFQSQQKFASTEPAFGFTGLSYAGKTIIPDPYKPGGGS